MASAAGPHPEPARAAPPSRLSRRQIAVSIAWGAALWLSVALAIRFAPGALFDRGIATVALFALGVPNAWITVWLTKAVARLSLAQLVPAAALASAIAIVLDGLALTWSSLYGPDTKDLVPVAALLLWGVGHIIFAAFIWARRAGAA